MCRSEHVNDFKAMARILASIRASEDMPAFDPNLVDPSVLRCDEKTRDLLAIKLQRSGYIEGLFIVDDIDNQPRPVVLWSASKPSITIKGMEFMQESKPLRKALEEIRKESLQVAAHVAAAAASSLL